MKCRVHQEQSIAAHERRGAQAEFIRDVSFVMQAERTRYADEPSTVDEDHQQHEGGHDSQL